MKIYFATVEASSRVEFEAAIKALDIDSRLYSYDRLESQEITTYRSYVDAVATVGIASEKVVLMVRTTVSRKKFRKLPGLVRVRTTPTYRRRHPAV